MPSSPLTQTSPRVNSVLIVDAHAVVREGLRSIIEGQNDLIVCAEAETELGARAAVRRLNPDVMITDLSLQRGEGIELVRDVRAHHKHLAILVLSMHDENVYAERMLVAGANGYIMKQTTTAELLVALRRVVAGDVYVSHTIVATMMKKISTGKRPSVDPIESLTSRELQVLHMIGKGMGTREIATSLNLSIKTIETHRQRLKRKLSLTSASRLVHYAMHWFIGREPNVMPMAHHDVSDFAGGNAEPGSTLNYAGRTALRELVA